MHACFWEVNSGHFPNDGWIKITTLTSWTSSFWRPSSNTLRIICHRNSKTTSRQNALPCFQCKQSTWTTRMPGSISWIRWPTRNSKCCLMVLSKSTVEWWTRLQSSEPSNISTQTNIWMATMTRCATWRGSRLMPKRQKNRQRKKNFCKRPMLNNQRS